eukprot:COSAG06_NODE_118_length_23136_cov_18.029257_6_plen_71_part_00
MLESVADSNMRAWAAARMLAAWARSLAEFWVLEQHLPWLLCACTKMLLHVAGFNAIVSRAPPVSGVQHAP